MYNFCTLFDSNYLSRGLAMYESLIKVCDKFHLFVFAFDNKCLQVLKKLDLPRLTVISLKEFETAELLEIKKTRTAQEYCWTCTPSIIIHIIRQFNVENCTYLDADLYFYSSPEPLFNEAPEKSVIITSHRYTREYDQSETSGKYCVQFVFFRNDAEGLKVLDSWRNACNEWCYNRIEDNKFGDQKYLDDWLEQYTCVHELQNLGGGMAPWNIQQYKGKNNNEVLEFNEPGNHKNFKLIFYHYHNLRIYETYADYGKYRLKSFVKQKLYRPYVNRLLNISKNLITNFPELQLKPNATLVDNRGRWGMIKYKLFRFKKGLNNFYCFQHQQKVNEI